MPLKLSLKPGEAVVVNEAVIRNGERRGTMLLETKARILRERDVMFPDDISTPQDATYFCLMQMYIVGETSGKLYDSAVSTLADWMDQSRSQVERDEILRIAQLVAAGNLYKALGNCRKLLKSDLDEAEYA
ncbi:flagellar biosynthesis repressor FlbT [Henriciella barbarensis]|uniref:Flagellar biosynthesis repressor FlbT n=1 Tax=Henriciella barbarensis TaxID=86342 RepID=A0A399R3F9_9PROT|nr:flagellar biosynthesis repressor FlbT [Henriciella barbarensis]RIJ26046.1 flagellar biosynthesis repressor FlbT [Henriciella barbarensis]